MTPHESELRQLAGRCLAMGLPGPELDADSRSVLAEVRPGTVILFARNTPDLASTRRLCVELQASAAAEGLAPLVICADQEGGRVQRLREGVTSLPAAMLLGQAGPEHVRAVAAVAARALRDAGVPLVLAPVADVNSEPENPVIGTRAFGADPDLVATCVAAAVEGYRAGGALSCAKHFPGHGATRVDSHLGLPVLARTTAELELVDLPPFQAAIVAGVDAILVGHLAVPSLDPTGTPASLSRPITTGLLRERLGWSGAILTDDLEMGALTEGGLGAGEIAVRAMAAGADLLFFCHTHGRVRAAADALTAAVLDGRLEESRLREAADHVTALALHVPPAPASIPGAEVVAGAALVEAAVRAGVRVVRRPLLRSGEGRPTVVSLVDHTRTGADSAGGGDELVASARRRGCATETDLTSAGRGHLVVGVRRPPAELLARIEERSRRQPTTVIALAEPWVLDRVPAAGAIAAGDPGRAACERALELALA